MLVRHLVATQLVGDADGVEDRAAFVFMCEIGKTRHLLLAASCTDTATTSMALRTSARLEVGVGEADVVGCSDPSRGGRLRPPASARHLPASRGRRPDWLLAVRSGQRPRREYPHRSAPRPGREPLAAKLGTQHLLHRVKPRSEERSVLPHQTPNPPLDAPQEEHMLHCSGFPGWGWDRVGSKRSVR